MSEIDRLIRERVIAFAKSLDGQDRDRLHSFHDEAKDKRLVFVYGESDDCLEFRGAIYDEYGAYEGGTVYITKEFNVKRKAKKGRTPIEAYWGKEVNGVVTSWSIDTIMPHAKFMIYEDGEQFCQGIVFSV